MYLENFKTREPLPFVYGLGYEKEQGITFRIHPLAVEYLKKIPNKNSILDIFSKNGLTSFEGDIRKNFGFNNCSKSSFVNGLIYISFPVITKFTLSDKHCTFCSGKKIGFRENEACYFCRGTGKKFLETDNRRDINASLYMLTHYLNWFCVQDDEEPFPKNEFGIQNIFLQLDIKTGVGGEISVPFAKKLGEFPENDIRIQNIKKQMYLLFLKMEGKEQFPNFEFYVREYEFCCDLREEGFYLQVSGQNGCSIHMSRGREFSCHNIDRAQQQLCLIAGLSSLSDLCSR